jgi:hypothetical protein
MPWAMAASSALLAGSTGVATDAGLPAGRDAVPLAMRVATSRWWPPKPTTPVAGMCRLYKEMMLRQALCGYADLHLAGLGFDAGPAHMLSAADAMAALSSWYTLRAWRGDDPDIDPAKFPLLWRQARLIELQRGGAQIARLRGGVA